MPKEPVWITSKSDVLKQITMRLDLLEEWTKAGIPMKTDTNGDLVRDRNGEAVLDYVPMNLTDFSDWQAKDNCPKQHKALEQFRVISRSTLNKPYHSETKKKILHALSLISGRATIQIESTNKVSQIEKYKVEIEYLKKVVAAQELEARASRIESSKQVELRRAERALRLQNENQLKLELDARDSRIAELTQALSKVAPLRKS